MKMATDQVLPPQTQQTFADVDKLLSQHEKTCIIQSMKERFSGKLDGLDDEDFSEFLKALFKIGVIAEDLSLIQKITANAEKKDEIQDIIGKCEPLEIRKFVGREYDVKEICKKLTNVKYPARGVNLFGESGVGKTTLAQEIAKSLKADFQLITIDLRGIRDLGNVYFHVLEGFNLPAWDNDKERFISYLKTLTENTLLILDNVEQLHVLPSEKETEEETGKEPESSRADFLNFLLEIVTSKACESDNLKLLLTSRERLDDAKLRQNLLSDYKVTLLDDQVSKSFLNGDVIKKRIPKLSKGNEEADKDMQEIVKLCKNIPYLLQCAKQMLREGFKTSSEVLQRLQSQPKEYACLAEQFESIPNDQLKELAVKISLLQRPFSVSTAMKIGDIKSNYDASIDLELLAVHKVISKVDGKKLKYDTHAQFKDFVKRYLCKAQPQYKEIYQEGEKQFFIHFSGKMSKLAHHLDKEFVDVYSKLEGNRANFELAIDISKKRSEVFDVLYHSDEHNEAALMGLLFEALKDINERKKLYEQWAEIAEKSGNWLSSAQLRCWQALQGADMEGTRDADEALRIAKESLKKAEEQPEQQQEQLDSAKSLFRHASGRIKWLHASKSQDSKEKKEEIQEGIRNLKEALRLSEDATKGQASTMKARIVNLIGNCYMELNDPSTAETYFLRALGMKRKLVGSDNHWEIPTYYNQIAQVHERRGMDMEKSFFAFWYKTKIDAEYKSAVQWMERALKLQEDLGVSDTEHTATFQRNLANCLINIGEYDKALFYANKCYEKRIQRLGEHPETARILYLTGIIHEWRKDIESARKSYEQAFEMEEALPEYNHSLVRTLIRERLEAMYKMLKLKDKIDELKERIKEIEEEQQYSGHWKYDPASNDVYRMKSNPRGLMVIINIQKFAVDPTLENREELMKELTERKSSERDVDDLTDFFSGRLNFKVCTIIDKPRIEILLELRSFAEDSAYKDYDCLAVCIMSHGKDDKFYTHDGNTIKVSSVYNMFCNSMCEVFRFKPKLFFIQACSRQKGSKFVAADGPSVESSVQHPHTESKDADMADMLIAYSSFEDYNSYRHTEEGSYFIQSLVRFFLEYADSEHVEEILTRFIKDQAHRLVQKTSQGRTQVPAPVSTLRKKLYFWPGMDFDKKS